MPFFGPVRSGAFLRPKPTLQAEDRKTTPQTGLTPGLCTNFSRRVPWVGRKVVGGLWRLAIRYLRASKFARKLTLTCCFAARLWLFAHRRLAEHERDAFSGLSAGIIAGLRPRDVVAVEGLWIYNMLKSRLPVRGPYQSCGNC